MTTNEPNQIVLLAFCGEQFRLVPVEYTDEILRGHFTEQDAGKRLCQLEADLDESSVVPETTKGSVLRNVFSQRHAHQRRQTAPRPGEPIFYCEFDGHRRKRALVKVIGE